MLAYVLLFFFFNDTATTEIYTLSLHDALPIFAGRRHQVRGNPRRQGHQHVDRLQRAEQHGPGGAAGRLRPRRGDRKSTRLNSSHSQISYAVFCLKKKKNIRITTSATPTPDPVY